MRKLKFDELEQLMEVISIEEQSNIKGGYWNNNDLYSVYGNEDYYSDEGPGGDNGATYNGGTLPEVVVRPWGPVVYLPIQGYVPEWGNWDGSGGGGGYYNPPVIPQVQQLNLYDEIATVFGFGSAVHQGTGMLLSSRNAVAVVTQFFGSESVDALKATAQYVGKIANVTSHAASAIGTGYSMYEIYNEKANTHTYVNLAVTAASVGAEIFIGAAAAPYLVVGGIAYGVFTLAGGN